MNRQIIHFGFIFLLMIVFVGCKTSGNDTGVEYSPQMYHSVPYEGLSQIKNKDAGAWLSSREDGLGEFYNSNPNNPHEMNMRIPPENTVPRTRDGFLPYRLPKDSLAYAAQYVKSPLAPSEAIIAEGKVLYTRFCWHCHGDTGQGDGPVGKVFLGVTAYNSRAVKDASEGHIFHVITHGKGRMGGHGSQISIEERWKIVQYVQTLQKQ